MHIVHWKFSCLIIFVEDDFFWFVNIYDRETFPSNASCVFCAWGRLALIQNLFHLCNPSILCSLQHFTVSIRVQAYMKTELSKKCYVDIKCFQKKFTGEKTSQSTREDYHKNICSQTTPQTKDDFHSTLRYVVPSCVLIAANLKFKIYETTSTVPLAMHF